VSEYGLRAWRALAALVVVLVAFAGLLVWGGGYPPAASSPNAQPASTPTVHPVPSSSIAGPVLPPARKAPATTARTSTMVASRRQSADLLRQLVVDAGWSWAVVAAWDARVARVCCDSQEERRLMEEVERLPGGTTGVLASPPTCRCIAAARRHNVMVAECRQEVERERFPGRQESVSLAFPSRLYGWRRPGRTASSTAVPCILLTRKRTEVQLLPRPPHPL
jgi:hypothetical protein